ncbi:MAG: DUF2505 domain-containing protein [Pegethrix bostrychoides GSE-TBD4-15B]|uniref:DUF2505 domain-containing protein n=1 Tax=Pegethrix bostrychoides GSE-TBD4-15B TaxID=2839662 RepID=A0A951P7H8_9CYAN|nr:DUF2505 domain-containing protein [Pegethrix bostrychoides GSE-TBD4-15B]
MLINASVFVPFPLALVYSTYRDHLPELVQQMASVKQVRLQSRQETNGTVQQVYEWHGKSEIPGMLKAFLSEDLLTWTDFATWKAAEYATDWRIQPQLFQDAVTWAGIDRYIAEGSGTRIESRGELRIDPKRLQGVPFFLTGQVSHLAEEMLGKQAEPNFVEMSRHVKAYLEQQAVRVP